YYVGEEGVLVHNECKTNKNVVSKAADNANDAARQASGTASKADDIADIANPNTSSKTLNQWLKDEPELLDECRDMYENNPEWWSIDPDNTEVFYRNPSEVADIRRKPGESGGHHPHGLGLGGPEGQVLTATNETRKIKNPMHSKVTSLQRKVINVIKNQ
ncbi:MAG: hypothetical protein HUJ56_12615, partial [Erysipelotrichaceae bacterium]|nr:hypothetical protein [Erysipelotrichaceae bacterium]